jgi:hypothetical protein
MSDGPAALASEVATTEMDTEEEYKYDDDDADPKVPPHPMVALVGTKRSRIESLDVPDSKASPIPSKRSKRRV